MVLARPILWLSLMLWKYGQTCTTRRCQVRVQQIICRWHRQLAITTTRLSNWDRLPWRKELIRAWNMALQTGSAWIAASMSRQRRALSPRFSLTTGSSTLAYRIHSRSVKGNTRMQWGATSMPSRSHETLPPFSSPGEVTITLSCRTWSGSDR